MPPRKKLKRARLEAEEKGPDNNSEPESLDDEPRQASPRTRGRHQKSDGATAEADAQGIAADAKPRRSSHRKYAGGSMASPDAVTEAANGVAAASLPPKPRGKGIAADADDSDAIMEAVVKVFCVHTEPNYSLPWQRKRQYSSSSSGFLLPGRRILTNAHCVDHFTQVKVKRRGSDEKHVASVLSVGTECDIALLTVEDDAFWEGVEPVTFGLLPKLQDAVTVVGYPIGGDTMSVTSGVVSRIEVTAYMHGSSELLGIQIDAAINSGNSGGPAFNEQGECVGIAFQSLKHEDAENIGYIIPTPVIEHFLTDFERNGRYTGFPCLGVEWQKLENPDLRTALKMQPQQKGVLVRRVEPTSAVSALLKQNDVLLSFDGVAVANDGTVPFRSGERISFSYLVSTKYTDEEAELQVLQGGEVRTVRVKLCAPVRLVPFHTRGLPPSYFIVAGLVFTVATVPYLKSEYGKDYEFEAPVKLLERLIHGMAATPEEQVVVLSQVLAADVNLGYEEISNTQVLSLNGERITNLADLVARMDGCTETFLCLDLEYNQKVVLDTQKAKASTPEIMAVHCISNDRSTDLVSANGTMATVEASEAKSTGKRAKRRQIER